MPEAGMRLHLDLVGGLAGDMFVACLLDAFPQHRPALLEALVASGLGLPDDIRVEAFSGASLQGARFVVPRVARSPRPLHVHSHAGSDDHDHDHDSGSSPSDDGYHRHGHVAHAAIRHRLTAASLLLPVRTHALAIFALLAAAEAAVHGVSVDSVEFHEVGAIDSIADIVAAAFLIDAVGPAVWTHGPIPLGGGVVRTEHGVMPVPAPATLALMEGMVVIDDGVGGERVTPTGAAILRYVAGTRGPERRPPSPERVIASGLGFGTRSLVDRPNAVRCTAFVTVPVAGDARRPTLLEDWVDAIEFDLDDQTAEDVSVALEALRRHAAVLQVVQAPMFGKKGRMVARIHVVARAGCAEDVARACFDETTTIGLRWSRQARFLLPRRSAAVDGGDGRSVDVKIADRNGATTAKVEMDVLADREGGHAGRERARRDAEARAVDGDREASA